ncbi:MAG TPA: amidohydrolase, partial [Candidatus Lachnoclostridium stercorigallinarum]|nr:amidohydrolase [Candidatus Lachnoclostridium stercorigallinarum]
NFVCSGFNDSHMHLLGFGNALSCAPLSAHTGSLKEMLSCLKEFLKNHPPRENGWIMGRGWNQDYFSDESRMPDRRDLDQVSAVVPICAVRACGHCLVVNTRALEILGITGETEQPDGGRIGMDEEGPDGRFFDNAMDLVYDRMPAPDKEDVKNMILAACQALNSYGVTSSQTDDYCAFRTVPWTMVNEAYRELEEEGKLTVRVYEQSNFTSLDGLREFVEAGNRTGTGTDFFRIGPLKMLGDGALGARTAYLSRPYADDPSTCGIPVFSQETMDEMVEYANEQGMQVAVHAIGDACLDRVLGAYEKALASHPREDHRHGIVHCQITRPDQLKKILDLHLHVYAQSIFLDYDIHMVKERVGEELASTSYSWKTLLNGGGTVSNGTDCPVELPDALACIQCAVTRKTLRDQAGPYLPEERFTVQEALDSYTSAGAYASFEEERKGKIAPGMMADFVVLGQNPFETEETALKDIPVLATYLNGKMVYRA